jgi:hypothetical protein
MVSPWGRPLAPVLGVRMRRAAVVGGILAAVLTGSIAPADDTPPATPSPPTAGQPLPAAVQPPPAVVQPPPQTAVQSVPPEDAEAILGQRVTDPEGKGIGRLVDVLVDAKGQPEAAVIDFGGFIGIGNRKVAVHWSALHFNPADAKRKVALDMTPDQIKAAPEFRDPSKAASVVTPADSASALPAPPSAAPSSQ